MNSTGIDGYRDLPGATRRRRRPAESTAWPAARSSSRGWRRTPSARPILSTGHVFMRNLRRRRPEPGVDREMLFLLATAKLNQAERFGVGLGETYGRNSGDDVPPERVYMELEEHYHTRLLAYVLDIFGLPFQVVAPPLVMRQFVKTGRVPARATRVSCSWAPRKWRAASCSTSCAASASSCSPTNPTWPHESSGSTARSSPTKSATSATAQRGAQPRSGRSCVGSTRGSDACSRARPAEISLLTDPERLHARLDRPFDVEELTAGLSNETFLAAHP